MNRLNFQSKTIWLKLSLLLAPWLLNVAYADIDNNCRSQEKKYVCVFDKCDSETPNCDQNPLIKNYNQESISPCSKNLMGISGGGAFFVKQQGCGSSLNMCKGKLLPRGVTCLQLPNEHSCKRSYYKIYSALDAFAQCVWSTEFNCLAVEKKTGTPLMCIPKEKTTTFIGN